MLLQKILTLSFLFFPLIGHAHDANYFDNSREAPALTNIKQLTFKHMGFEKAGEGYFSPDSSKIIFQAYPSGKSQYQIFTLDLVTGFVQQVSTGEGACTCAYFHPQGHKVIFASSHEAPQTHELSQCPHTCGYQREDGEYKWAFTPYMNIYEANLDGSNLKALTTGPSYHAECAYSNDGLRIVFASNVDGGMNLYTMASDGTDLLQITYGSQGYNGGPFFSPDNTHIIFRADYIRKNYLQIYSINSNGHDLKQLTNNNAVNWAPYWHPYGKIIAYTTSLHGHEHYEIYLMNIESGVERRLTHNATFDGLPVFNKEGTKLLWTSQRGSDKSSQLFIADFTLPKDL